MCLHFQQYRIVSEDSQWPKYSQAPVQKNPDYEDLRGKGYAFSIYIPLRTIHTTIKCKKKKKKKKISQKKLQLTKTQVSGREEKR